MEHIGELLSAGLKHFVVDLSVALLEREVDVDTIGLSVGTEEGARANSEGGLFGRREGTKEE